ncbi:efflux RND transporter periplasmic adaptor subunit [Novosphingobium resinovorum]|uniref:Efflux transporter periplasmic adaptor subunit n=1 Tax=Novosphingobium resinovorum TaxID=158500 RepID=A0A031JW40_9SPHN|nr:MULTISPECIES: efflux RND transporter periplasmic adaptor subunit [Sphingomonadaceae]AOR79467.1 efflux transporter periplasmic adaptor subunit [Novosphingobium resinovorum]EJU11165.1 RND family efflux transporter MFP subunit [Sphingomonas sp. LH128]EZP80592.1 RND family efflux transporter MFP subunit [Novosphingobium resinovorum]MBF7013613.1 efflux RND transporter periplasmic adaptor subunit [Novosphingobium sp. HR1a]WJM25763.1 efflux RND transporter periplasmic adaptor subunit [Novosphingob
MLEPEITENTASVPGPSSGTLKKVGIGAAVVALAVVAFGVASRISATNDLEAVAADAAVPTVTVVSPATAEGGDGLVLPGTIQAYNSAAINARTNGYVRRWLADIGDHVNAGQTLAILDAPEIDQQLAQAKADYQTALANQRLAATTSKRWQSMLAQDAVSQQEADEKAGDLAAKTALANAALASVRELNAKRGFTQLSAPFSGVVTSRSAQIGALVVSGNAASQPLFTVSDVHRMRIYVRVPQVYSSQIHAGMKASLDLPEFAGRDFEASLTRSANSVDAQSGAMLVELQADNSDGALKPGAFAHVRFAIDGVGGGLRLPGSAIMAAEDGPSVAIVGKDGTVTLRRVTIARDEGKTVLVSVGLKPGDKVIDSPPDSIRTGDRVRVAAPDGKGAKEAGGNG